MKYFKNNLGNLFFSSAVIFFAAIIFLPAVYILIYFFKAETFVTKEIVKSIILSFEIGLAVTFIDLIFGLPLAWSLVRSKSKFIKWLDSLIDLSLVMPTAALGFSVYLYWGSKFGLARLLGLEGGIFSQGPMLIILLHVVFTLPYMARSIAAAIAQINLTYEQAALTLGANPFTIFRTISLPLFKNGVITGSILSFTRSLSETGATMMVAGAFTTAPVLIIGLKEQGQIPQAAAASVILILSAIIILFLAKLLLRGKTIDLEKVYPAFEKSLLSLKAVKNIAVALFFVFIVFLPTIFIVFFNLTNFYFFLNGILVKSLIISFAIAFLATSVNLFFSVPLAYLIARNRYRMGKLLDSLSEVVLLVPTSALGLSLVLFWRQFLTHEILILFLTHLSFSFPLLVKPLAAAFKDIPLSLEEASYSLGTSGKEMFIKILLPLIKPAVIAGSIMAFMRSLSETGATLAATNKIKTIPVLIVEFVERGEFNQAAFACVVLFIIAFAFLIILKHNKFESVEK